jgi:hypothetical protein
MFALRNSVLEFAIAAAIVSTTPADATDYVYSPAGMSGFAVNALVRAYEASGLDGNTPAPFTLQPYVVQFHFGGNVFEVAFLGQTTRSYRAAWVDCKTGAVATTPADAVKKGFDKGPPDTEGFVLPGIVAGEIIAVYRYALSEGYVSKQLKSGAFNLSVEAHAGGIGVGFLVRDRPQEIVSIKPAPTPTPTPGGLRCLSGACNGWTGYRVDILNNHVQIKPLANI